MTQATLNPEGVSSVELVQNSLKKIEETKDLNIYLSVFSDSALEQAKKIDARRSKGEKIGPLGGLPIALKDNVVYNKGKTTCASKILGEFESPYNATVVEKIEAADGIIIGKTNLDEFAMGSSTENSAFGPTLNPRDPSRVAGGSSGGSAAAVAAETVRLSIGSDTGGSIRQPSAFCGVVGLKPTYGRVSRYGLVAFASSLDQIGPMGQSVDEVAQLMNVISGNDSRDQTSANVPVDNFAERLDAGLRGKKLGVPSEYFSGGLEPEMKATLETFVKKLEGEGAELVEVSLPFMKYGISAYYILATAEASSNLSRYDGVRYSKRAEEFSDLRDLYAKSRSQGFGWEVKKRIMLGTYVLSAGFYDAYYAQALKVRRKIKEDFEQAFTKCDVLLTPTTPDLPPKVGDFTSKPMDAYLADVFTVGVNLAGLPAASIPAGRVGDLSVSLQIIGKPFAEKEVLQVSRVVEQLARL